MTDPKDMSERDACLKAGFTNVINLNSAENESNTPDYLLADYLLGCLKVYERAVARNAAWHSPEELPE